MEQLGQMIYEILNQSDKVAGIDANKFDSSELAKRIEDQIKLLKEEKGMLDGFLDVDDEIQKINKDALEIFRERISLLYDQGKINSEEARLAKENFKKFLEVVKQQERYNLGLKKGNEMAKALLQTTLGLSTEWAFLGGKGGAGGLWKGISKGISQSLTITNILASTVQKVVERAFQFDKLQADLFSKTGIRRENLNIEEMASNLKGMSSDYEKTFKEGLQTLAQNYRSFSDLSQDQIKQMGDLMAISDKRGVAGNTMAESFITLNKAIGLTVPQARDVLEKQLAIADASTRPPNEVIKDFQLGVNMLARFGNESVSIVDEMRIDANKANVELRTMLGIAEKADTFEGAAQMAQSFNVAVAGPFGAALLNPLELMSASMEDKVRIIREKMGGRVVALSPRVLRELSKSLGVPENELLSIFRVSGDEIGTKNDQIKGAVTSIKEQKELIRQNQKMQEKFMATMVKFADTVLNKIGGADGLISLAEKFVDVVDFIAENIGKIALILGIFKGFSMLASFRGATPANPMFTRPITGAIPGLGKVGTLGKALLITGAAATTGFIASATRDPVTPGETATTGNTNQQGTVKFSGPGPSVPPKTANATGPTANLTNDGRLGGGAKMVRASGGKLPQMVTSKYVVPDLNMVHEKDKMYFAKDDGPLNKMIQEARTKLAQKSKMFDENASKVISIDRGDFRRLIEDALGGL